MFGTADGVFKLEGRQELEAETVLEGGDTEVEKPIDQEEAEEVEEEEGEMGETGDTNGSGGLVEQAKVGVKLPAPLIYMGLLQLAMEYRIAI